MRERKREIVCVCVCMLYVREKETKENFKKLPLCNNRAAEKVK